MTAFTPTQFLSVLDELAPLSGAAEWDNAGLIVEGSKTRVQQVLLTLDLTPAVAEEALKLKADWIVAYHPPIFEGLKFLTRQRPLSASLLKLIEAGVWVYAPHTALDTAYDGVSDWLASFFPGAAVESVNGSARRLEFKQRMSVRSVADRFRRNLNLPYLRIATPEGRTPSVKTLGLCPGAGGSALREMNVDAVFTGEMRYHDILAWQASGRSVILCEHGLSERPYLKIFKQRLADKLPSGVTVSLSKKDREPVTLLSRNA